MGERLRLVEKNPCTRIKLPQQTGGRMVTRTILTTKQVIAIAAELEEPYATLVLFLATSGLRIGEAIAIKWSDFDGNEIRISRRILRRGRGLRQNRKLRPAAG